MLSGLPEPSNIAHSAMYILASLGALELGMISDNDISVLSHNINGLTQGLLAQQQENGGYSTQFDNLDSVYQGIDFYSGEAMLALLEAYRFSLDSATAGILDSSVQQAILPSLQRAFGFYHDYYRQANPDANYNIWQIQAFARFYCHCDSPGNAVYQYVVDMCNDIVASKSWKYELARGRSLYPNLQTVEIACGLDALVDGIQIASEADRPLLVRQAHNAVEFLEWSLDLVPEGVKGGLGYGGTQVMEQRLDVTGHAISALTKWHEMRQEV